MSGFSLRVAFVVMKLKLALQDQRIFKIKACPLLVMINIVVSVEESLTISATRMRNPCICEYDETSAPPDELYATKKCNIITKTCLMKVI